MPERENTCCFTGHREYKLPWGSDENDPRCRRLQQQLFDAVDAVYAAGIRHFICGMANGCDLYFFDAARYLRLQHPEVTIEAAIPYSGQADRWRPELRERYAYDLRQCDYQTLVQETYTPGCMMRRNRYMVDASRILIAAFDGRPGGTARTLEYAAQRRLEIVRALATNPSLLLLDEPAAGMNPKETEELMDNIIKIRDQFQIAIMLIEHDMNLVMGICEGICVLNFGRVIAKGTAEEIQHNPEVIEAYLGRQKED